MDKQDMVMALFAFFGCLRGNELTVIGHSDLEMVNDGFMVTIIRVKTTSQSTRFLIPKSIPNMSLSPAGIVTEYLKLVTPWLKSKELVRLWPRPTESKFTTQFRGKNYLSIVAKKIARFLGLDDTNYSGHSFRRSSATAAADSGVTLINLKRFGGWKSDSVASGYIDESAAAKRNMAATLVPSHDQSGQNIEIQDSIKYSRASTTATSAESTPGPKDKAPVIMNFYINQQ